MFGTIFSVVEEEEAVVRSCSACILLPAHSLFLYKTDIPYLPLDSPPLTPNVYEITGWRCRSDAA